jgi:hypothetical protein
VRIARVFAKYDTPVLDVRCVSTRPPSRESCRRVLKSSPGVSPSRALQKLTQELGQPLNDEEARLAMTFLDENGDGKVDYMEFVAWWAGSRSLPSAAPLK